MKAESGWRPIETAPKDGRRIIVFRPTSNREYIPRVGEDYFSKRLDDVWAMSNSSHQPTHWMPLPEPPNES